jgi:hypothetical protein
VYKLLHTSLSKPNSDKLLYYLNAEDIFNLYLSMYKGFYKERGSDYNKLN